jgi:hypothetical protein
MIIFESTLTTFVASFIFWGSWGSIKNWLELKIEPRLANLASLNPWNTLYNFVVQFCIILLFIKWIKYINLESPLVPLYDLSWEPLFYSVKFFQRRKQRFILSEKPQTRLGKNWPEKQANDKEHVWRRYWMRQTMNENISKEVQQMYDKFLTL